LASPTQIAAPGEGRLGGSQVLTPKPQPDPVLLKHGITDNPQSVVQKVRAIKQAHDAKFDRPATPGHIYDVLRANVPIEDIPKLYDAVPASRKSARIAKIGSPDVQDRLSGVGPEAQQDPSKELFTKAWQAAYNNEWESWLNDNKDLIKQLDDKEREKIALAKNRGDLWRARDMGGLELQAVKRGHIIPASPQNIQLVVKAGVDPVAAFGPAWDAFNNIMTAVALGPPVLAFAEGKGIYDTAKNPLKSLSNPGRSPLADVNVELGKAAVKGVYQDVRHPKENFEYLLLDVFGFGSLLAGGAARTASAARATGGLRGKTAKLFERRNAGTRQVLLGEPDNPFGQLAVEVLNSENTLVREAPVIGQKARTRRANEARAVAPPLDPLMAQKESSFSKWKKRHVSQESKARGRLASDIRIEQDSSRMSVNDIEKMSSSLSRYQFIKEKLPAGVRNRLTAGEDAVLRVLAVDEPGGFQAQINLLRDFHQRQIVLGLGDPSEHRVKLDLLNMAEKHYAKPSKTLLEAIKTVPGGIAERETILRDLGMKDETQIRRVAQEANVLRGTPVSKGSALSELYFLRQSLKDPSPLVDVAEVSKRIEDIRSKYSQLPSNITRERGLLEKLTQKRVAAVEKGLSEDKIADIDRQINLAAEEIARSESILSDISTLTDQSYYFPLRIESKQPVKSTVSARGVRKTGAGIAERNPTRDLRMKYQFEGNSLTMGEYRMDTSKLVAEELGRAQASMGLFNEYKNLLAASTKEQRFSSQVPIRTPEAMGKISPQLREILNRKPGDVITAEEAKTMVKRNWHDFVKDAYGATFDETTGRWKFPTAAEKGDFRWVDSTLINADAFLPPSASVLKQGVQAGNSLVRFLILYPRLAYLTNLIGSAGMALWYQGVFAVPHVWNAMRAKKVYGKEFDHFAKEQLGGGRYSSNAQASDLLGRWGNVERKVAFGLNKVTDEKLRISALINRLRLEGFKNSEFNDLAKGHRDGTLDPSTRKRVDTAILRAKKDSVEWDNLSWFEKQYLRQLIFIYPWQSRSAVWNLRAIVERPTQSALMAQIGRDAMDDWTAKGGEDVSKWMSDRGFMPLFWDNGNPVGVFTGGVNSMGSIHSLITGVDRKDYWRQLGGPLTSVAIGTITGTNEFGQDYKKGGAVWNLYSAILEQVTGLPQVTATEKISAKGNKPLPLDITNRDTLANRLNKALEQVSLSPGWSFKLAGIPVAGSLITGGAGTPRELNAIRVRALAYKNLPAEKKLAVQRQLMNKALGIQADALGRSVPANVRDAVDLQFDTDAYVQQKIKENAGNTNTLQETNWALDYLVSKNVISEGEANKKRAYALNNADKNREHIKEQTLNSLIDPTGALKKWDDDVTHLAVASSQKDLPFYTKRLADAGLGSYSDITGMKVDDLRKYGRQVAEYNRKADDLSATAGDKRLSPAERKRAELELKALEDTYDKDVFVSGRKLPSPVRLKWALQDDNARAEQLIGNARASWSSLTSFEKETLGVKTAPDTNTAWAVFNQAVDDYASRHNGSAPEWARDFYAKAAGRKFKGFYEDYLFSRKKLAERLEYFKPIKQSDFSSRWNEIIALAKTQIAQIKNGSPSGATVNRWKTQIAPALVKSIQEKDPEFDAEVQKYGYDIIEKMLDG
jgi:hypothetical protein